ncbi:hypothetical protein PAPHI01_1397 [Pancytospora philotis]|nr:hypothetical protein PAPHI01_1397 [Pancytospora philotis]
MRPKMEKNKRLSEYLSLCKSLCEWCIAQNNNRAPAFKIDISGMQKLAADYNAEMDTGHLAKLIEMVLLSDERVVDIIRTLAGSLKYGYLEVLHDAFKKVGKSDIDYCLINTMEEGGKIVRKNGAAEQLDRIRKCIQEELAAALERPTREYLYLLGAPTGCSHSDALAHILRRREVFKTDFYTDLAGVFTVLLEDESRRSSSSGIAEPLLYAASRLSGFGTDHFKRCRDALLRGMMVIDDEAVAAMLGYSWIRKGMEPSYIIDFLASNVGENAISPRFLSNAISWYMNRAGCSAAPEPVMDLLRGYYFALSQDSPSHERLRAVFEDRALLNGLPPRFLYEIAEGLHRSIQDPVRSANMRRFLSSIMLDDQNRGLIADYARQFGNYGLLHYILTNARARSDEQAPSN